ncbi:hypothetical protein ABZT06_08540 [Streptomyces sp. NPDC005483]|uniref:hypothetical protein n=1 Tax=Streptomyces sp. NPDC005483 TaxID=3154882 RepID=UPI0033A3439A
MRPADFRDHLVDLLKNSPEVQQVAVPDGGPYPYALSAVVAGKEQRWQVIGQLADGSKHDTPTAPVEGAPPAWSDAPVSASPDAWLAGVLGRSEPRDVERMDVWSAQEGRDSRGLTVRFRNGERAFVRLV